MGQGRGGHVYADDELGKLAGVVVARVRPNRSDHESVEDCWQTAYAAGLQAAHAARRSRHRTSRQILILAMQTAVYRLLRRRKDLRESDLHAFA